MTTDAAMTLTQWLSPGFPVGAFAYSHGLEWASTQAPCATSTPWICGCATLSTMAAGAATACFWRRPTAPNRRPWRGSTRPRAPLRPLPNAWLKPRSRVPRDRVIGVETGGCPHTAIREDASINLAAIAELQARHPMIEVILIESGGDNLSATFSPEPADVTVYVIDVAAGEEIPCKGGPAMTRSDILVIDKTDLAPHVGASLDVMHRDATRMRPGKPFFFTALRHGTGVAEVVAALRAISGLGLEQTTGTA